MANAKPRKVYMDYLRVIAIFLVIFNHMPGYTAYYSSSGVGATFFYMFFTMLTRVNVPLFFMISGALLFGRDESYGQLFKKRILRFFVVLLCASTVVYLHDNRKALETLSIGDFFVTFFKQPLDTSYWYLYAYLGMLVMLPFLRKIVKSFCYEDFRYFVFVYFLLNTVLPILNYILGILQYPKISITGYFAVPFMTTKAFFYPLCGYYLANILDIRTVTRKQLVGMGVMAFLGIIISSCLTYHQGINGNFTQSFVQLSDYVTAIFVFVLFRHLDEVKQFFSRAEFVNRAVSLVSQLSFGIYLMEPVLREQFYARFQIALAPLPLFPIGLAWCVVSMIVCGSATYLLKKLPIIRKLL